VAAHKEVVLKDAGMKRRVNDEMEKKRLIFKLNNERKKNILLTKQVKCLKQNIRRVEQKHNRPMNPDAQEIFENVRRNGHRIEIR
jgi:hypothetical protein